VKALAIVLVLLALWPCTATATAAVVSAPVAAQDAAPELGTIPGLQQVRAQRRGQVVVLEGRVAREADRELAETVARATPGVAAVVNRVDVSVSLADRVGAWREASLARLLRVLSAAPLLALAAAVVWLAWFTGRMLARRYRRPRGDGDTRNPFLVSIKAQGLQFGLLTVGLLVALQLLDALALAGAVIGSAGVAGIALGFAFRDLAENYVASILLSLRQPFAPDDHVVVDGNEGIVVGLNSRATLLMTPDGNHLRLPNSLVFKAVILNYTRNGLRRFDFRLRLSPEADADMALADGLAAMREVPGLLAQPPSFAQLQQADCEWLELMYFGWCDQREANYGWVRSESMRRVRARLAREGLPLRRPLQPLLALDEPAVPDPPAAPRPPPEPRDRQPQVAGAVAEARDAMGANDLLSDAAIKE
jgi:small conductance mechanosensitive channel